jgi:hypothetical protein
LNGTYLWTVECYDNTTMRNYGTTNNRTVNVDLDAPEPYIQTQSGLWFNYNTPSIAFNITDNMDSVLNYTFYANSSLNRQGTINNASPLSVNLLPLADGIYVLTLEALDEAYNKKNSTPINIFVDTTKPLIVLANPENGNSTIDTNIFFSFTAYDNLAQSMLCNLTVDRTVRQNFNITPGFSNFTYLVMTAGIHFWNVTCIDTAGNFNTSQTWNFTIPLPDLTLASSDIKFNTTLVEEGKNITINATIYNLGETDAQNVLIQFFEGNYNLSKQINGNFTYNFTAGSNITINVTWQVTGVGTFDIYVVVDPPISSGGNIVEINESNNYAFNRIEVGSYSIIYGNLTGLLNIRDLSNRTLYQWNVTDYNGTKIYAVDFDSNVNWARLQAISRDTSNGFVANDFRDIDLALRMENNTDSVNATWTLNNNPRLTNSYIVYLRPISNVPVVNSTNTSNFLTGILWDTGDGNTQYNGTQDLVFMTTVNINQQGKFGIYDYELKIPANLRIYKNPNLVTVALYTELP